MRAISIRQPWAWLIVHGFKDVENREWATNFRGRVLVHAGKAMSRRYYEDVIADLAHRLLIDQSAVPYHDALERGGVIGSVDIDGCVTAHPSPWFTGPYGFVLRGAQTLPFTPWKGALGFFDAPLHSLTPAKATHG